MVSKFAPFTELLSTIVDNRGRTCPVASAGLPLIATNCVSNDTLYPSYETTRFVDENTYRNWFRGHPQPGDILFVCKGSPGRTNLVPSPVDFCIAQDMVAVRADPEKIYPKYLFAVLRSAVVQKQIDNMHVGTLIPHFKKGDFDKLRIPLMNENEQSYIGDLYCEISQKIDLNRRINQTLEAIAQALFKSWFVDFDPVKAKIAAKQEGRDPLRAAMSAISGKTDAELDQLPPEQYQQLVATAALFPDEMVDSELGEIPKGWVVRPMPESIEINPTRQLKKGVVAPYLDMANVPTNSSRAQTVVLREFSSGSKFINGDTLLARITPCLENGKTAFVDFLGNEQIGWGSTEFIVLRPKGYLPVEFAYFLCRHPDFKAFAIAQMAGTSGRQRVPNDCFANYLLTVPSQEVAVAFGIVAKSIMSQIRSQDEASKSLATLRDTLLPKLLSGELSLTEAMAEVEV